MWMLSNYFKFGNPPASLKMSAAPVSCRFPVCAILELCMILGTFWIQPIKTRQKVEKFNYDLILFDDLKGGIRYLYVIITLVCDRMIVKISTEQL